MCHVSVLLIEDDTDIQQSLRDVLEGEGCTVTSATDGEQGLKLLHSMVPFPDVVLLDLMLPGRFNGWDVLCVKQTDPQLAAIPVVILTAAPPAEARARPLEGASLILRKPFSITQLLKVVNRIDKSEPG